MTKKSTKAPAKKSAAKASQGKAKQPAPTAQESSSASPARGGDKVAKTQLVDQVADKTGLTKKQADQAVSTAMEAILDAVKSGKSVGLPGLGTLSVKATAARTGVRPGTSERIQIPAGRKVSFKVANTLKGSLGSTGDNAGE